MLGFQTLWEELLPGQAPADTSVDDLLGDLLAVRDPEGAIGDV